MSNLDWNMYPNFSRDELQCKHTNECSMHPDFMKLLQLIRDELDQPIYIYSGFRSVKHPVEQKKNRPGEHTYGLAVDIGCSGKQALDILEIALNNDVRRIGVKQHGSHDGRFLHIGMADKFNLHFPAALWTY